MEVIKIPDRVINTELSLKELKELTSLLLSPDDLEEILQQKGRLPATTSTKAVLLSEAIKLYEAEELCYHPETTQASYSTTLQQFYCSMVAQFGFEPLVDEIKATHISRFLDELLGRDGKPIQPRTAMRKLATIKSFYRFMKLKGFISLSAAHEVNTRIPKQLLPVALTPRMAIELIELAGRTRNGVRDQAMIATMLYAGCRVSELTRLTIGDINLKNGTIRFYGKRSKQREVPLHKELHPYLVAYIRQYGLKNQAGKKLFDVGVRRLQQLIEALVKKLEASSTAYRKITPHVLRHTFAVTCLTNGENPQQIFHF